MRNSGPASIWMWCPPISTWIEVRVRQFLGSSRSQPPSGWAIIGTPCEVPVPRKINSMRGRLEASAPEATREAPLPQFLQVLETEVDVDQPVVTARRTFSQIGDVPAPLPHQGQERR